MTKEEFIESKVINGRLVNIGIDDAGQQYFFEYIDNDGNLKEIGCGAYNANYMEDIKDYFEIIDRPKQERRGRQNGSTNSEKEETDGSSSERDK